MGRLRYKSHCRKGAVGVPGGIVLFFLTIVFLLIVDEAVHHMHRRQLTVAADAAAFSAARNLSNPGAAAAASLARGDPRAELLEVRIERVLPDADALRPDLSSHQSSHVAIVRARRETPPSFLRRLVSNPPITWLTVESAFFFVVPEQPEHTR